MDTSYFDYLNELFWSQIASNGRRELTIRRAEYENHLNEMWAIYMKGNPAQIVEYNKQVESIKRSGGKVLRNSAWLHKIVIK